MLTPSIIGVDVYSLTPDSPDQCFDSSLTWSRVWVLPELDTRIRFEKQNEVFICKRLYLLSQTDLIKDCKLKVSNILFKI